MPATMWPSEVVYTSATACESWTTCGFAGEEPGVDRHQRDAGQRAADEDLDAFEAVGHERRDAFVGLDPERAQRDGETTGTFEQRAVGQLSRAVHDGDPFSLTRTRRRAIRREYSCGRPTTVRGERHAMRQCDRRDRLVVETVRVEQHRVAAIFFGVEHVDEQVAVTLGGIRNGG